MSEESTAAIAESMRLEQDLRAGAKVKAVQLVNTESLWLPVGAIQADPNHTRADVPHPTPVLDALRAAVNNPNLSEQDRASARECLRVSFHE
jgi:hypothetical protein